MNALQEADIALRALSIANLNKKPAHKPVPGALLAKEDRTRTQAGSHHHVYTPALKQARGGLHQLTLANTTDRFKGLPLSAALALATNKVESLIAHAEAMSAVQATLVFTHGPTGVDLQAALCLINIQVGKCRIYSLCLAVVGGVGAGKTTFLALIEAKGLLSRLMPPPLGTATLNEEHIKEFRPELDAFSYAKVQYNLDPKDRDLDDGDITLEALQVVTYKLQVAVAKAGRSPTALVPTVSERSPLCNMAFALVQYMTGLLT